MSTFLNNVPSTSFKTRPTILQVIPTLGSGGVEIETLEIAHAITAAGGRSLIAANLKDTDQLPSDITCIDLPLNTKQPFQMIKNITRLKELIQKEKVDIVHVRSRAPAWSAYKATHSLGIPFITTYHAAYKSQSIFKTFYNSIMARGDRIIAISPFIQNHIIKEYTSYSWFDSSKIHLIPRGIDLHYFDPSAISQERVEHLRKTWDIPASMKLILLPGRLSRSKGHQVLIQALSHMKHANVMALFVGSAKGHESYCDQLLREAAALDLEGRVKWVPPCPDIPAAYQLADIIVCPSLTPEGFGRLMAEAQAMKKPIIAAHHGAAADIIEPGITGWLIPPGNSEILAETLDAVLQMPQNQLEDMGQRERERVQLYFSKEMMITKTIDVYKEFVN